jgi:hypothetical protein
MEENPLIFSKRTPFYSLFGGFARAKNIQYLSLFLGKWPLSCIRLSLFIGHKGAFWAIFDLFLGHFMRVKFLFLQNPVKSLKFTVFPHEIEP